MTRRRRKAESERKEEPVHPGLDSALKLAAEIRAETSEARVRSALVDDLADRLLDEVCRLRRDFEQVYGGS